jgi:hypothetical protein
MKIFLIYVALVILCLTVCYCAYPDSRVEGEQIKQEILAWLDSINSIQCTYRLRIEGPPTVFEIKEVKFLWQGQNFYYEALTLALDPAREQEHPEMIGGVMTESLLDGKFTLLGHQRRIVAEVNRRGFLDPSPTRQMRKMFHVQSTENTIKNATVFRTLQSILSLPGFATLIEREGERILAYWTTLEQETATGLNIYLDEENRIVQADFVDRPAYCTFEEAQRYVTGDIYRTVRLGSSLFLTEYNSFGDIWFPAHMREELFYTTDKNKRSSPERNEKFKAGEITACEFYAILFGGYEYDPAKTIVYDLNIDPKTIKLNKVLKKSDFEIEIPPGTNVSDRQSKEVYTTARETWLERHADLVIILIALGILGGITVAGWRYWLGKP